jgi:hypothetical protein
MDVDYFVLADAAAALGDRFFIHGAGWDTIYAPAVPATQPSMAVAARYRVGWNETNTRFAIRLEWLDADGNKILKQPMVNELVVGRPPSAQPGDDQLACHAYVMNGTTFHAFGDYALVLYVDDQERARTPIHVRVAPPGAVAVVPRPAGKGSSRS